MYNLMIGVGIVVGFLILEIELKKRNYSNRKELIYYVSIIISLILGFLGAKIFDLITQSQPITLINIMYGGFTFLGGIITAIIILFILSKIFNYNFFEFLNILSPSLALAHSFGRIGCFFAGCCYGKPTKSIFGIVFPKNSLPVRELHMIYKLLPIHPTQIYESILEFLIFLILFKSMKFKFRFPSYLVLYGIGRFLIEFLRGDNRGFLLLKLCLHHSL